MNHAKFPFPSSNGNVARAALEDTTGVFNNNGNNFAMNNSNAFNHNNSDFTFGSNSSNNNNTTTANSNNNITANGNSTMQRRSKRRPSENHRVVTGRSFKRLRLDHVHVGGGLSSAQSIGTLSVGTMGGDLESNDEDLGDEEDDDDTEDGNHVGGSRAGGADSIASSWVASLGSTNFRKRRMEGGNVHVASSSQYPSQYPSHATTMRMPGEDDDAATCSGMTTAALAPRRRRTRNYSSNREGQKRRAIGFTMDTIPTSDHRNRGSFLPGQNKRYSDDLDDDLVIEDLEVDLSQRKMPASSSAPPIERIPDPLLVAAQHAAHDGEGTMTTATGSRVAGGYGVECCSSVTEEETNSLAEDEASIGAISIGANTAVSALSGGTMMMSGTAGSFDRVADGGRGAAAQQQHQQRSRDDAGSNDMPPPNNTAPAAAVATGFPSLNHILGGLHKERLSRLSTNRPPSGGELSLRSMGSDDGARSAGGGASYRSLPGNLHVANGNADDNGGFSGGAAAPSWNAGLQTPLSADEDAEMEEADDDAAAGASSSSSIAAAGGFNGSLAGSVAVGFYGSRAGGGGGSGFGNLSRASSGGTASVGSTAAVAPGDDVTSGWKHRVVNLPSHSSLY
mmetsp:Transcript_4431/g.8508  ORF Transcript_4431/g.8508 Transcript_4431/m.8508 type:complete len:621 (+) Transcript_4431:315-2177(+)|eukprot:CAMPEP_0201665182 /NCGR_PEP_ID=MMETSP0494-20130426/6410_1 /ASSEMBLY_ACC=CAM_ASM_000839 /TAXON_ID=420259 /ORGANISM="Thalassiosira gravida, Strain GMp14c1" /LENGTH=620 /DNA_ID=CAMNT_0048144091 /DNA_START=308 /DNA_END=2170 /DNA_ORIENTATION=-